MAIQTVQAQGSGDHSHRVHELVYGNSLEYLDVFEKVFRHLGFWFLSTLAAGYGDAQEAHHYYSQHTKNCSPRSCFHVVSFPARFVSRAVYVRNDSTRNSSCQNTKSLITNLKNSLELRCQALNNRTRFLR